MSLVCGLCARSHHQESADADTFMVSPALGYLMIGVGLVCCVLPLLPGAAGDIAPSRFFWYFSPFWLGSFIAAAYFFRYRVVVRELTLSYGALRRRTIFFADVIDLDVLRGRNSPELRVYLSNGRRLKFSGMLGDFDELVGMVNSHMAGMAGTRRDSAAKIQDQEDRKKNKANWLMLGGMSLVGVVLLALWRMELLN